MRKNLRRAVLMLLAVVMLVQLPGAALAAKTFPDVPQGEWYYDDVMLLTQYGIIGGDENGYFHPKNEVKRGEFIKMLTIAAEYLYTTKPSTGVHWSEDYWNCLNDALVLEVVESKSQNGQTVQYTYPIIPLNKAELDNPINRYEMAYLINRVLYMVYYEQQMMLKDEGDSFANHIADYNTMDKGFQGSVEQVYAKGILIGMDDAGSFMGDKILTKAEAATAIVRLLFGSSRRVAQTYAIERPIEKPDTNFQSFALKYRGLSNAERRQALFGNPNKTYFTSAGDAKGYMVSIEVPVWKINSSGVKYSSKAYLEVHKLVEQEVRAIFNEIYNDPERFPMNAVGGARYSDTMRHSWGCAIDINPNENYYINYRTGQTVGSFCYKNGTSPYCITPNSSVVRAFARQGWGWGGQGWSTAADYMHFSILASGG